MVVSVFAPASIGNISVGFDLLGAALLTPEKPYFGDVVTIHRGIDNAFDLQTEGPYASQLPAIENNIVLTCLEYFIAQAELPSYEPDYLKITLEKNLPVGSGLGSSATSIIASLVAANAFYNDPFDSEQLLQMMAVMEGKISGKPHYDNVAPAYLGGIQLINPLPGSISQTLPIPDDWYWVIAYPGLNVSTSAARELLPTTIPLTTAISAMGNIAIFIDALHKQDWELASTAIQDVIAEPYRKALLPGFDHIKQRLYRLGSLAVGISGSGPTMFAVAPTFDIAQAVQQEFNAHYIQNDLGFSYCCRIDTKGARIIQR